MTAATSFPTCFRLCFALLFCLLLAGCATDRLGPPAFDDSRVPPLQSSGDPGEMARVATDKLDYALPLDRVIAALKLARKARTLAPTDRFSCLAVSESALFASSLTQDREIIYRLASEGYDAATCEGGISGDPELAYYAGAHLGLILRHKGIQAIGRLPELEQLLKLACEEPRTDHGGPLRVLGMLYLRAPAWPKGIGDLDLAIEYLDRAANAYPLHPPNHIFFAEALMEDDQSEKARQHLDQAAGLLDRGRWGDRVPLWRKEIASIR